ncbi:hypothetical protein Desor_2165 [Desulfosporosinus orientis DSM 765]|uniref:Peptidase C39-like domain-containing protein n=1 Tax=Desulfosporosinus orientis (strain ATCC 19365 / DSM 765 / NCIMB 8382 / VKM B-1628 / Singapore I) TaxID=768706 RepID=G7W8Q9_DESOD|nr:C39 family peptidase [Desulfosporosinus orientis]AET67769.1 hypothetical protein Desor_2165 [Desulfosporosinus orientis DSM 765]
MGIIKGKGRKRWLLLGIIFAFLLSGVIHVLSPFPTREFKTDRLPDKYEIPINTGFERQGKNQCAAFSTAFVLRYFGQNVQGAEVYAKIPYKVPISGYVLPKGIVTYFQSQGYSPAIYKGDLNSLKTRLVQENRPVIVLVGNGLFWQHYMTFLGYDDEKSELYFFDSGRDKDENAGITGNRTMTEDYFLKWWSNGLPVFNNVYITVEKRL